MTAKSNDCITCGEDERSGYHLVGCPRKEPRAMRIDRRMFRECAGGSGWERYDIYCDDNGSEANTVSRTWL